jgi:CrcB protein
MNDALSKIMLVGVGGFLGSNLRYWLGVWMQARFPSDVPWSTMFINVSGSMVAGLFMGLATQGKWPEPWKLLIAVGLLGGFTTFSAFSVEAARLLEQRAFGAAAMYIGGNVFLCLIGAIVGLVLAGALARPA